jgi:flagellin-specific chaperone FliS
MFDMKDLLVMFDKIDEDLNIAKLFLVKGDTNNALYNLDHVDTSINYLRVKLLELKYGGVE